jgi:hypothetical protein
MFHLVSKREGGGGGGAAGYNIIIKEGSPECLHNTIEAKFMHMAIMCYPHKRTWILKYVNSTRHREHLETMKEMHIISAL